MWGKFSRLFGVSASVVILLGCAAGNVAFRQGRKAELRKDWDTALVQYQQALKTEPENAQYIIRERQARIQASYFHLKQGQRWASEGRMDEAAGEFQKAAGIDPTNEAAAQELAKLVTARAAASRARESTLKKSLQAAEETESTGAIRLQPFPKEPLAHFRIAADSRKVFETLGKLAALNVAFTSDFQPRPISIDLTNVKVEDALRVLALQTKSFWKPVTSNTILVVPDTPNNRRDYGDEIVKTIYLSNPLAAADRTAITTALKQVLGLQRIIDNPDSNAIIIRDSPEKVAAAEKMIHDLDRGKAEILVDVAVVEADRNRTRDLGITPASITATGTITPGIQTGVVFAPPLSSSSGGTAAASTNYPLNNINYKNLAASYAAVLPSVAASALLNDSRTHILQNPQVRVTDGQQAKLRIGTRIPYATGSFLPGVSGTAGGFNLLASTQFQYQDVGVNIDLTPNLLPNGEIGIKAMIEISSVQAPVNIGGLSEPTFGQRRIEHYIRLKEGEVSLLGGLLQTSVTHTISGVPFLGQIPILGNLFSTKHLERADTEVMVMLTPRVIRLPEPGLGAGREVSVSGVPTPEGPGTPAVPTPEPPPAQPQ